MKKSQIFFSNKDIYISNFICFNFDKTNKEVILLGGNRKIEDETILEDNFNQQILSIEKFYYSISNVGKFHYSYFDEKGNDSFISNPIYDIAFLSNDSYIVEFYEKREMFVVRKNRILSEGLDFKPFISIGLNDI